jgi:membrane-associated phospholipid phosphatase
MVPLSLRYCKVAENEGNGWRTRTMARLRAARAVFAPEGLRRYRARLFQIYVAGVVLAFSLMTVMVQVYDVFAFELAITRALQEQIPGWLGVVLHWVNWPGFAPQNFILVGLMMIFLSIMGLRWEAVAALFAAATSGGVNYLIKIIVRRPRPGEDLVEVLQAVSGYSFPSAHVMFYTAFFGFLLFLAFVLLRFSLRRGLALIVPGMLVGLVGLARMYVGDHWAIDVVAGYLLGSLVLILSIMFYRWGKARFFVDQPASPPGWPESE